MTTKIPVELSSTPGIADSSNATAITIDSSERVMIGTTDAGYPDYGDSLTLGDVDGGGGNAGMSIRSGTSSYGTIYFSDDTGTAAGTYAGKIQYNHSHNSMVFATNSTDKLTINSAGNVGIGLTNNTDYYAKDLVLSLGAEGGITLVSSDTSYANYLMFADGTSGYERFKGYVGYGHSTDTLYLVSSDNARIYTGSTQTEKMRMDSSGRMLIGVTTNPSVGGVSSSHFTESLPSTNWIQSFRNSQSTPYGISIKYTATPNDTGKAFIYCEDGAPAARFELISNGGIKNYSGNNVNLSDEREKKNIVSADNQLENIKNLLIKSFHYNEDDDSANKRLGVIAQEVEINLPHLVEQYSNIGGNERKGVKEQQVMWMAIKAIQEQQDIIEDLKSRIETLEG